MRKYDFDTEQQMLDKALVWHKETGENDPVEAYAAGYRQSISDLEEVHHKGQSRNHGQNIPKGQYPMSLREAVDILKHIHPVAHIRGGQNVADAIETAISYMDGFPERDDEVIHEVVDAMDMWPEIQDKVCFPKRDAVMVIQPAKFYPGDAVNVIIRKSDV